MFPSPGAYNLLFNGSGGWGSSDQGVGGLCSFWRLQGESVPCLFWFLESPVFAGCGLRGCCLCHAVTARSPALTVLPFVRTLAIQGPLPDTQDHLPIARPRT